MKKLIFIGILISIIGFILLKVVKRDSKSLVDLNCESKMTAIYETLEEFEGTPKPVDFTNFPEAKLYYTRITEAVKEGVNFSGHYVFIPIGCGTDCIFFTIVDAKTGKIIAYESDGGSHIPINNGNHLVLKPIYAGTTRDFYKIVETETESHLEKVCSEVSTKDMYQSPE